MHFACFNI